MYSPPVHTTEEEEIDEILKAVPKRKALSEVSLIPRSQVVTICALFHEDVYLLLSFYRKTIGKEKEMVYCSG